METVLFFGLIIINKFRSQDDGLNDLHDNRAEFLHDSWLKLQQQVRCCSLDLMLKR